MKAIILFVSNILLCVSFIIIIDIVNYFSPIDKYSILDGISMLGYVCVLFLSQIIYTVMFYMKRIVAKYISVVVILAQ